MHADVKTGPMKGRRSAEHIRRGLRVKLQRNLAKAQFSEFFKTMRRCPNMVILEKTIAQLQLEGVQERVCYILG